MNQLQSKLLLNVSKSLCDVIKSKNFFYGDMDDWNKYAKKLEYSIRSAIPILETLAEEIKNENT